MYKKVGQVIYITKEVQVLQSGTIYITKWDRYYKATIKKQLNNFSSAAGATLLNSLSLLNTRRIQIEFRTNFLQDHQPQEAASAAFEQN